MRRLFAVPNRPLVIGLLMLMLIPASVRALPGPSDADLAAKAVAQKALRYDDRGEGVIALQRMLQTAGFDPGPVDGVYGPKTEEAVRKAQAAYGLTVDGLAGKQTVAALKSAGSGGSAVSVSAPRAVPVVARTPQPAAEPKEAPPLVYFASKDPLPDSAQPNPAPPQAPKELKPFALTFHGAPDPDLLPALLATLKKHDMQATFFVHGETAERVPAELQRLLAAGHEIGSHGYTQQDMTRLSDAEVRSQLLRSQQAIERAAGQSPTWFRPPQGRFSNHLAALAKDSEMEMILWTNVTVRDQPTVAPATLAAQLVEQVYPGSVLMLHQDRPNTVAALDRLLGTLRERGYQSVSLSKLQLSGE